ncbi:S41 family peptidase [Paenibacillus thermotolerans]|uniref:S41 family peptidase n=1 Tax=Paenibacillus thermotolerans TaxID=3027807 RepID=UPI003CC66978
MFKGRTVVAFVLLACFAGSILTLTITGSLDARMLPREVRQAMAVTGGADPVGGSTEESAAHGQAGGLTEKELEKISTVFELVNSRYFENVDRQALADGALEGLVAALGDPYSEYLDKEEIEAFSEHIHSSFSGIGAEVTLQDGNVVVVTPQRNTPAERAGILPGDIILSVNGEALQGLDLHDAVEKIRGPKGTQAKLRVLRKGSAEPIDIIVVRDEIQKETVEAEMLDNTQKIGKIIISQFAVNTAERFAAELEQLEAKGMKGLIIDVRNNPGGVVSAVQDIAEQFVPKGKTIMHMEYKNGKREKTESKGTGKKYPVVVLINKGSASASEILGAAIQESAGGVLVGETTFGKGLVQTTVQMKDNTGVKLTIAKWLTPDGDTINKQGITPDIVVEQNVLFETVSIPKDHALKYDMAGDEVKNLQGILKGIGYAPGRTDGYFDRSTEQAVRSFQKNEGLSATGIVDEATAARLEQEVIKKLLDPKNDNQLKAAVQQIQKML